MSTLNFAERRAALIQDRDKKLAEMHRYLVEALQFNVRRRLTLLHETCPNCPQADIDAAKISNFPEDIITWQMYSKAHDEEMQNCKRKIESMSAFAAGLIFVKR